MDNDLAYKIVLPDKSLSDFVESFWVLQNQSDSNREAIALPDGSIDLFLSQSTSDAFNISLLGISTQPEQAIIAPKSLIFTISFKLFAIEFIFNSSVADLINKGKDLANDFWHFNANDLNDFDAFCKKTSQNSLSFTERNGQQEAKIV